MNDNLLRFKKNQNYICFDFETCHLNLLHSENKPWQLGYGLFKGKKMHKMCDHFINGTLSTLALKQQKFVALTAPDTKKMPQLPLRF